MLRNDCQFANPCSLCWIIDTINEECINDDPQPIIFDSVSQSIEIAGQGYFKPQFLQHVTINETNNIAIKTTLHKQAGNPTVTVFLTNPVASFDITFFKDHLDVNWKMQTDAMDGSHGLLGTKF